MAKVDQEEMRGENVRELQRCRVGAINRGNAIVARNGIIISRSTNINKERRQGINRFCAWAYFVAKEEVMKQQKGGSDCQS